MDEDKFIEKCKKILEFDEARISTPMEKMFFIIGFKKHTKDDKHSYTTNEKGERIDWKYLEEHVVASGYTEAELFEYVQDYAKLLNLELTENNFQEFFYLLNKGEDNRERNKACN